MIRPTTFIDCEASALHNGFPVEVGWAHVDEAGAITVESWLVRPPLAWVDATARWSWESQQVHGIPLTMCMRDGRLCDWIAARMNALFAGQTLYSDAPDKEMEWIDGLYRETPLSRSFRIADVAIAFEVDTDEMAYDIAHKHIFRRRPHRAGPDARQWADLYQATRCRHRIE